MRSHNRKYPMEKRMQFFCQWIQIFDQYVSLTRNNQMTFLSLTTNVKEENLGGKGKAI